MTAGQVAILIRDLDVGTDIDKMHSLIQGAIDDAVRETYKPRMVLVRDDYDHWYLIPETEVEGFDTVVNDGNRWEEFDIRWGDRRLEMHPSNYSFIGLQEIKSIGK